ncbi:hypothetical protein D3C77_283110 [compost metagenome]
MIDLRQKHRQLIFRYRLHRSVLQMQDRDRLSPIPLTAEQPIAQAVAYFPAALTVLFKPSNHLLNRFFVAEAIQEIRVDVRAISCICSFCKIAAFYDLDDR